MSQNLRIALVACGQIADAHLLQLRRVAGVHVVAVYDCYGVVARQGAARFAMPAVFDDVDAMFAATRPDVVHVTTAPTTRLAIAVECVDAGAHLYVEQRWLATVREAQELLARVGAAHAIEVSPPAAVRRATPGSWDDAARSIAAALDNATSRRGNRRAGRGIELARLSSEVRDNERTRDGRDDRDQLGSVGGAR